MMKSFTAFIAIAALASQPALAGSSYAVDSLVGLDTNDGSVGAPFKHFSTCVPYSYAHSWGGAWCVGTQGQTFDDFVPIFYPFPGGGTLQIGSSGPAPIILRPLDKSVGWAETGDGALVGIQAAHFAIAPGTSATAYWHDHNFGVTDFNVQISADLDSVGAVADCDFDAHFNINNGITLNGITGKAPGFVYKPCMGSTFDINGAETHTGSAAVNRWAWNQPGSRMMVEGNASFVNPLTTSAALVNTSALLLNVSGYPLPGGLPSGGGTYCTSQTYC